MSNTKKVQKVCLNTPVIHMKVCLQVSRRLAAVQSLINCSVMLLRASVGSEDYRCVLVFVLEISESPRPLQVVPVTHLNLNSRL